LACAFALSAAANTATGAAVNANPATAVRRVIEVEIACAMVASVMIAEESAV